MNEPLEENEPIKIRIGMGNEPYLISTDVIKTEEGWCITPEETFSLTITCANEEIAKAAKVALYQEIDYSNGELYYELAALMVTHGIECVEIKRFFESKAEPYKALYSQIAKNRRDTEKLSPEHLHWKLQIETVAKLGFSISCVALFNFDSSTSWIFKGEILKKYDSHALGFYVKRYSQKYNKIWVVEPENHFSKMATICWKTGLARRGREIPFEKLTQGFSVKSLSSALGKKHYRRESAVQALLLENSPYELLEKVSDLNCYYEFTVQIDEEVVTAIKKAWDWAHIVTTMMKNAMHRALNDKYWLMPEATKEVLIDRIFSMTWKRKGIDNWGHTKEAERELELLMTKTREELIVLEQNERIFLKTKEWEAKN